MTCSAHQVRGLRQYTLMKIGTVYDKTGIGHAHSGARHMPVHWRCGHNRHVAHAKVGKTNGNGEKPAST
jgi:hypothetical protein